jgi:hypothetical protein
MMRDDDKSNTSIYTLKTIMESDLNQYKNKY